MSPVKINRPELDEALLQFALEDHGVVLGDPGVGKTHSLRALARSLKERSHPFMMVQVDTLGEATAADLKATLGYSGDFRSGMSELFDANPAGGVIILDGYDAARSPAIRERLTDRIGQMISWAPPGWHVLVSVRTYDARKSPRLLAQFGRSRARDTSRFRLPEVQVRHFYVPELLDVELDDALKQLSQAAAVLDVSKANVRQLLKRPFNLWLLEQIAKGPHGMKRSELESEVELLGLYWDSFITTRLDEDSRIAVLSRLTDCLVSARRLQVDKAVVFDPLLANSWNGLMSDEVIANPAAGFRRTGMSETVGFRHNILFDFAVAVLAIGSNSVSVAEFLKADPYRPLFLRPSLTYFFGSLWSRDRASFWDVFWDLLPADELPIRLVGRVIPPYTVVKSARSYGDLDPLLQRIVYNAERATSAIVRVLGALQAEPEIDVERWAQFAVNAVAQLQQGFTWEAGVLLDRLSQIEGASKGARVHIGAASRQLLLECLDRRSQAGGYWYDTVGANMALRTVLRSIDTDVEQTSILIDRIVKMVGTPNFPIRYFYMLCDGVRQLHDSAPAIAQRVYRAAFGYEEASTDVTQLGGIVLPMTSTRKQDFEMCRYALSRSFGDFLKRAPVQAISACVGAVNDAAAPMARHESQDEGRVVMAQAFLFRNGVREFLEVSPYFSLHFRRSELEEMVETLKKAPTSWLAAAPEAIVEAFAASAKASPSWGLLFERATEESKVYAGLLHELALATPILLSEDLNTQLGAFVGAAYPEWTRAQRAAFEATLMALIDESVQGQSGVQKVGRLRWLLTRPDHTLIETEDARELLAGMARAEREREPEERPRIEVGSRSFTTRDWLAEQGVPTEEPANARVIVLRDAWTKLAEPFGNTDPSGEDLERLHIALEEGITDLRQIDGVDKRVLDAAWTALAQVAVATGRGTPPIGSAHRESARKVLLAMPLTPAPERDAEREKSYKWAHWSPSLRTEAIQGWSFLQRVEADDDGAKVLREMARSAEPSERFLLILYAPQYWMSNRALFWDVVETVGREEQNEVVSRAVLQILSQLGTNHEDRRRPLVGRLLTVLAESAERESTQAVAGWLFWYALSLQEAWAKEQVDEVVRRAPGRSELLSELFSNAMREVGRSAVTGSEQDSARKRCREWVIHTLEAVSKGVVLEKRANASVQEPDRSWSCAEAYVKIVDGLIHNLWIGSVHGARDVAEDEDHDEESSENEQDGLKRQRVYLEAVKPVIEAILASAEVEGGLGMIAPSAFRFMEITHAILPLEPALAMAVAARIAVAAKSHGFQLDSMAAKEALSIVEIALADYKREVAESPTLDHLLALLDVFADAGWTEANRLVWRLEEVYR
jgi:hypothetical protein